MANVSPSELAALRLQISRLEGHATPSTLQVISTGALEVDSEIPDGGLVRAALHEVAGRGPEVEHGCASALFIAGILSRLPGQVLWILSERDLFAPALCNAGLSPDRVLFLEAGKAVLLAMEEGLRVPGLAGVVAEINGRITLTESRRLQLAAETSGVTGIILRRSRGFNDPVLSEPIAAVTRWRIGCRPGSACVPDAVAVAGVGRPVWGVDLTRCRGGEARSWIAEACDAQNCLSVVPDVANRPDKTKRAKRASA